METFISPHTTNCLTIQNEHEIGDIVWFENTDWDHDYKGPAVIVTCLHRVAGIVGYDFTVLCGDGKVMHAVAPELGQKSP